MKNPINAASLALALGLTACSLPPKEPAPMATGGATFAAPYRIYSLEYARMEDALSSLSEFLEQSGLGPKLSQGSAYDSFQFWGDEESNTVLFTTPHGKEAVITSLLEQLDRAAAPVSTGRS